MTYKFSQTSQDRMIGIDERLIDVAHMALKLSPIDFGIPADGGKRTAERQKELCDKGVSKCDGYLKRSYHQTGKALDVYAYVDGSASWDKAHLTTVAAAMLQAASVLGHKLEWGGHFNSFLDMPHFQIKGE